MSAPTQQQRIQQLHVTWWAFVASVGLHGLVVFVFHGRSGPPPPPAELRWLLLATAALVALASLWWYRRSMASTSATVTGTATADTRPSLEQRQSACIVTWALSEAVSVFGLILGFLSRNASEFLPFAVAAWALLYAYRPLAWGIDRAVTTRGSA